MREDGEDRVEGRQCERGGDGVEYILGQPARQFLGRTTLQTVPTSLILPSTACLNQPPSSLAADVRAAIFCGLPPAITPPASPSLSRYSVRIPRPQPDSSLPAHTSTTRFERWEEPRKPESSEL